MLSEESENVKRHGKKHQPQRRESIIYDKRTEAHLAVARRLFKKFDTDGSGELDEDEVNKSNLIYLGLWFDIRNI